MSLTLCGNRCGESGLPKEIQRGEELIAPGEYLSERRLDGLKAEKIQ